MWKNLRIRSKMMIGFALVLAVFAASIAVTWSLMSGVSAENAHIIETTIPGQALATKIDESAYELFLAVRAMQYRENDEAVAEVQKRVTEIKSVMNEITGFHADHPETAATTYLADNVFPKLEDYFASIEQSIASIAKKKAADNGLTAASRSIATSGNDLQRNLWSYIRNKGQTIDRGVYWKHMAELDRVNNMVTRIGDARRVLTHANDTWDIKTSEITVKMFESIYRDVTDLNKSLIVPEHRRIAEHMKNSISEYIAAANDFIAAAKDLDAASGIRNTMREEVNAETSKSIGLSEERILDRSQAGLEDLDYGIIILCASAAASVLLGLVIAFLISRSITNPLARIVNLSKRAGGGDLTIGKEDFQYSGRDELGSLAGAMSAMIRSQYEALKHVVEVSGDLADGAGGLSEISEEANASMEEIKASIDQVSMFSENNSAALQQCNAGVEELSAGADTVAQSASDSAAFIAQVSEVAGKAVNSVNRVIDGMREVDENARVCKTKVGDLVNSVERVSGFVSIITNIADQTNLLSLNAAIEAARAGEVGRGFAVVAEEVRKLAAESAKAAQEVNGIIIELQEGAQASIDATIKAGSMLGGTLVHAEQAQEELDDALSEIVKVNGSIQSIAAVAQEQAASCKEVACAIDSATASTMEMAGTISNIRMAAEGTAMSAQKVTTHSESMNEHAQNLTDMLAGFKLETDAPAQDAPAQVRRIPTKMLRTDDDDTDGTQAA